MTFFLNIYIGMLAGALTWATMIMCGHSGVIEGVVITITVLLSTFALDRFQDKNSKEEI